jgi:uncharacterized protein
LGAAEPWLARREAEHNLILGIAGNLAAEADDGGAEAPYLAVIHDASEPIAVALRTPPYNLVLSEVDDPAALELLADDLAGDALPGVTGPPAPAARFAELWIAGHGGRVETRMRERVYQLSRVIPPRPVSGGMRRAAEADRALLSDWIVAFHDEALPAESGERVRRMIADWDPETGREFWLWEDGGPPVSLVGAGSQTPRGIRIGPVYTPPEHRGRGYASNLTAQVSQHALDAGRRFCFLYTDLANPTSNRIYAAIGYEPVTDAVMLAFEAG